MDEVTTQQFIDGDKIGVLGSPSSTSNLAIDILGEATTRKLIGELAYLRYIQDKNPHYAIGQITDVALNNLMLEDATMKNLIRVKGAIESISGIQDTHRGRLSLSAVFGQNSNNYFPSLMGTVPPTGTPVGLIDDRFLDKLLERYRKEIFYLGRVYGSTPKMPLWFKHFGRGANGAGEAYHMGVFGKTGSGKSVLARMLLLAYARHPEMSIYIIDPQGEFAMDIKGEMRDSGFDTKLKQVIASLKKEVIVKSVNQLVLQGWPLFTEVIRESNFFPKIGIKKPEEMTIASEDITRSMKGKFKTTELVSEEAFFEAFKFMGSESSNERFKKIFKDFSYSKEKFNALYATSWKPVCELFRDREGSITIEKLLHQTFNAQPSSRPVVVIDLSASTAKGIFWSDAIQALAIKSLLDFLKNTAEFSFRKNQFLNTLVILDEAHRLAPSEEVEDEAMAGVRATLIDAVRTTRKYGLGWMFISQTLASLPKEILEQMRILFFGFGLAFGKEFTALSELAGGEDNSLKLYQSFRDPHSSFDVASKQYNFMSIGPVSPLSFAGTPLFFTAYNDPVEFLKTNGLIRTDGK
ncbi:MAG: ATP-binding protein [Candidatus Latescibacteria bacterium]|nr:ATP-binding protein [Candidatus Latescibacterota bacterium]